MYTKQKKVSSFGWPVNLPAYPSIFNLFAKVKLYLGGWKDDLLVGHDVGVGVDHTTV